MSITVNKAASFRPSVAGTASCARRGVVLAVLVGVVLVSIINAARADTPKRGYYELLLPEGANVTIGRDAPLFDTTGTFLWSDSITGGFTFPVSITHSYQTHFTAKAMEAGGGKVIGLDWTNLDEGPVTDEHGNDVTNAGRYPAGVAWYPHGVGPAPLQGRFVVWIANPNVPFVHPRWLGIREGGDRANDWSAIALEQVPGMPHFFREDTSGAYGYKWGPKRMEAGKRYVVSTEIDHAGAWYGKQDAALGAPVDHARGGIACGVHYRGSIADATRHFEGAGFSGIRDVTVLDTYEQGQSAYNCNLMRERARAHDAAGECLSFYQGPADWSDATCSVYRFAYERYTGPIGDLGRK